MRKKISVSISKDILEVIKCLAERSNMSVSRYIETVLLQDIQELDAQGNIIGICTGLKVTKIE